MFVRKTSGWRAFVRRLLFNAQDIMLHQTHVYRKIAVCLLGALMLVPAHAQVPPDPKQVGPADANRIRPEEPPLQMPENTSPIVVPKLAPDAPVPEQAENAKFILTQVNVSGVTAFPQEKIVAIYRSHIGKEVSLKTAYDIAAEMTQLYRDNGYFLSRVIVPNQTIENGALTLAAVEGYVGDVEIASLNETNGVVDEHINRLMSEKPLRAQSLESFLLRLNDLAGVQFRAVLSPIDDANDSAIRITLMITEKEGSGYVSVDNYNSRYVGPHQATMSYSTSILPYQQTSITAIRGLSSDALSYIAFAHEIPLYADIDLQLNSTFTNVQPGFNLKPLEVKSRSEQYGIGVDYQWIRTRQQNVSFNVKFDRRDTTSDTLGIEITNDIIRALRVGAAFDTVDPWSGYTIGNLLFSQGLDAFGTDRQNPLKLSREEAKPSFTKLEFSLARLQRISDDWSLVTRTSGQISEDALYSAEEFGYGGQVYGRAYDASELIGDQGVVGSIEVRYDAYNGMEPVSVQPFSFLDGGIVTNHDEDQLEVQRAVSVGAGVRFTTKWDQSASLSAAVPIGQEPANPIYGFSRSGPRLSFQFTQKF